MDKSRSEHVCRTWRAALLTMTFALLLLLTGCTVADALHGREAPDLRAIVPGAPRAAVEAEVGRPVSSEQNREGGMTMTYKYLPAARPSVYRAFAYSIFDVLSLGLWELIAAPVPRTLIVDYTPQDEVLLLRKPQTEE